VVRRRQAEEGYVELHAGGPYHADPRHQAVKEAIRELPDVYRVAVTLRHMEGMSYEEIAEVLQIGVSAAKMRVKRGVDALMERLNPRATGEPA
jgi:RNA polymerase sigma factor (sigma-70 family)